MRRWAAEWVMGLFLCGTVLAADVFTDWETARESPQVNSINRLPPRTYSMPLESEDDALTDELEPSSPYVLSLNGTWRFSWAGNPDLRVKDFWKADFDDLSWFSIDVPSCVELRGFGSPGYTNVRYPHANAWPKILDRDTRKPDYNPVSSYRRTFAVPESWKGRDVILRFDGVYSAYCVWVNGKRVGYAEDSKLPSEFDITPYLNRTVEQSNNVLAVEVYRWCDGSYLEDQDMFRFSGIFRDVTLWARPKDGIWDFTVRTIPDGGYDRWKVEVEGVGAEGMSVSLYDADKKRVCDLHPSTSSSIFASTLAARAWSAEDPYLYTLVLRKGEDIRMKRVGFKEQRIAGSAFTVNGKPVKFKGVNRHEASPENGRAVSRDEMIADATLMKRYNVNAVRTSHYPDHRLWYDICDRFGLYVIAEANVEGHEPGYEEKGLGRFPEWDHSIVERNARHVVFYRNNPCVTMWSVGNETGHGDCFRHAIAAVRKGDPSRPVHWERGSSDADVDSCMYPPVEWVEWRGKYGDTGDGADEAKKIDYDGAVDQTAGKCAFICEYAHAMGNAVGNFAEYWEAFYRHPSLCGGCVWDWIDQALWKESDQVDPKTGGRERYLAYGGDFDEEPHDGPFCLNGLVGPLRQVSAKLIEVGHVHRNLVVTRSAAPTDDDIVFELWNRFSFTRADAFLGTWKLRENGVVTRRGGFEPPALAPLSRCSFTVSGLREAVKSAATGAELFVDFAFETKSDAPWAGKGWAVARDQVALTGSWRFVDESATPVRPVVATDERTVTATLGGTKAVFDRTTGTLCELVMNGKTILKDATQGLASGPLFTCTRAFTDNDWWVRAGRELPDGRKQGGVHSTGLSQLRYHARPIAVDDGGIRTVTEITGRKSAGFTQDSFWTFAADGSLRVRTRVTPHGTMPPALPRMGLSLRLDPSLERMRYYGRGPRENYVDRRTASFLGVWDSTVSDQLEPYVRPQDNGYKCDVRWVSFADGEGKGVRIAASEPLFVQALHCSCEDLEFARHRDDQTRHRTPVPRRPEVYLNLDVRQLGLGGASCGPLPMSKYVFPVEPIEWSVIFSPLPNESINSKQKGLNNE